MRSEQVVFSENRKCSVKCICSERREGSERIKECPKNIPRSERSVLESMKVKVRHEEDLTELTSSLMHGSLSSEVD